ncbi:MAG TPA: prolyl oligopeptidase family serine peptidase, partial [Roseiflexaceae bacterium]|nr:prolyl oligopeptidase family serine peptidase [Roseiflexaceae bacterium]
MGDVSDAREAISIADLYELGWIETPSYSPDGRWIAYVRVTVDKVANRYRRAIWLQATQGGAARRLTTGGNDSEPCWNNDSSMLAFVSDRADKPQIYTIRIDGGEARRLTNCANGAHSPAWSPDGRRIALLASVNAEERALEDAEGPPPPATTWEQEQAAAQRRHDEEQRQDPRVITRMPYRSGTAFFDDRRSQVYVIDVPADDESEPGAARRLTDEDLHFSAPAWMPDGLAVLSTATRDFEADSLFAYYDIVRVPAPESGREPVVRLTSQGYSCFDPRPSPDGRWIAFLHRDERQPLALGTRIAVFDAAGGPWHDLTFAADLNVEEYRWAPESDALLFTAGWQGEAPVYRVALAGDDGPHTGEQGGVAEDTQIDLRIVAASVAPLWPAQGQIVDAFDVGPDGSIVCVAGTAANPCEVYLWQPGGDMRQLTTISERVLRKRVVAAIEELRYPARDNAEVQGWVVYPPGFDASRRYPLAVHIHGGPHVMWGPGFRSMWHEFQVFAAQGYVTFYCNPRGSEGYGRRWRDAIHGAWGSAALDIQAGIDAVIARGGIDE